MLRQILTLWFFISFNFRNTEAGLGNKKVIQPEMRCTIVGGESKLLETAQILIVE